MSSQQLDEETIFTVAREIRHPQIRAMYLGQVCHDLEVRHRLEQRLAARRRWQFGLRSLFVMMLIAAILSAFVGISVNTAIQAQRRAEYERLRAMQAAEQARDAMLRFQATQNALHEEAKP